MSMTDSSPTPESERTVNLRIAYIALADACVVGFVKAISGSGRPHTSHDKSPSAVPVVSTPVQYDLNTATPDESGKLIVPGDETKTTLVLDIPFAANVPDVSAKLELYNPECATGATHRDPSPASQGIRLHLLVRVPANLLFSSAAIRLVGRIAALPSAVTRMRPLRNRTLNAAGQ